MTLQEQALQKYPERKYTKQEFYEYLIRRNYSPEIATELADIFAYNCDKARETGIDDAVKAHNVFRKLTQHLTTANFETLLIAIRESIKSDASIQAYQTSTEFVELLREAYIVGYNYAVYQYEVEGYKTKEPDFEKWLASRGKESER